MAACTCRRALDSHHQPAVIPQVVRELVCVRRPVLKHQAAPRLGGGVGRAPVQCQRAVDAEPAGARRQPGQAHIVLPELAPGKRGLRVEEALVRGVVVEQPELVRAAHHAHAGVVLPEVVEHEHAGEHVEVRVREVYMRVVARQPR